MGGDAKLSGGDINGEGQNFSEGGFVKILAGGGGLPPQTPLLGETLGVQSLSCASTTFRSNIISMCVVPLQIHHPDSSKVLDTYAMLDNCSQGIFVKKKIIEALGITGADTRVTMKTLNGQISQMTTVVRNLKVAGLLGKRKWIKLP